jgi:hypothetical protein
MIKSNFPFLKFIYVKTFPQHGKLPWGDISFHSLTAWSFNGGGKKIRGSCELPHCFISTYI